MPSKNLKLFQKKKVMRSSPNPHSKCKQQMPTANANSKCQQQMQTANANNKSQQQIRGKYSRRPNENVNTKLGATKQLKC